MAKLGGFLNVSDIRGKLSGVVFTKARSGHTLRTRVKPGNPRTSKQLGVRSYLTQASRSYKALSSANVTAWNLYAQGLSYPDGLGNNFIPTGNMAFVQLAAKFLQNNPAGTVPLTPPATTFTGDVITITGAGGVGSVSFTPSASNTSGVTTELLIQRLPAPNRRPNPNGYRTNQFHVMVTTTAVTVTEPAGTYALAYRFVKIATGEAGGLVGLGTFSVT